MRVGEMIGEYQLVQKTRWVRENKSDESWVFMVGDHAIEWNPENGVPTVSDLDAL